MLEVRDSGVKVSVVNPGSVATDFSARSDPSWMLSPDDVAEAVHRVVDTPPKVLDAPRRGSHPDGSEKALTPRGRRSIVRLALALVHNV